MTTEKLVKQLDPEAHEWLLAQATEFMKPYASYFGDAYLSELSDDADSEYSEPGYYARLSAPGYLDCTDWIGPFDTVEDAYIALYCTWGY